MSEQRLIDANALIKKEHYLPMKGAIMFHGVTSWEIENSPTIDPETLPVVRELRERLARYEQAEAEGRLWILAVDVWPRLCSSNSVYIVEDGEIQEDYVIEANIGMASDGNIVCCYITGDGEGFTDSDIGRTVFLTSDAAEAALKGRKK